MKDVIVIGMGPAGMNAALYAKRSGMDVLILEGASPGGLLNKTSKIENYIGLGITKGPEIAYSMFEHINNFNIEYKIEEVRDIAIEKKHFKVTTTKNQYTSKSVIICTGRQPKKADFDPEGSLVGKGLSYCAVCDAPLYKNKSVAVIGGGNSAFEESIYLSDFASKVYIIIRKDKAIADQKLIDEVLKKENIEIIYETTIEKVNLKDERISSIKLSNKKTLKVSGIFVFIGYIPSNEYLNKLGILTNDNYISVDSNMRTKIKGIYAAGDVIKKELYQIVTSVSDGAIAAISAKKDIC